MEDFQKKEILESFLSFHGIEMSPTARLSHCGRRFDRYFSTIAKYVKRNRRKWDRKAIADLVQYVSTLSPTDFEKVDIKARPIIRKPKPIEVASPPPSNPRANKKATMGKSLEGARC